MKEEQYPRNSCDVCGSRPVVIEADYTDHRLRVDLAEDAIASHITTKYCQRCKDYFVSN